MGFADVAEEVRNLAQRSANSARETAAKIADSVSRSQHGVDISAKVEKSLQEIVERVRKTDALIAEIAQASHEQSQGLGQVNAAVGEMDRVTQANAASAEESASAAAELSEQSRHLQHLLAHLETLVEGRSAAQPAERAARPTPTRPARGGATPVRAARVT